MPAAVAASFRQYSVDAQQALQQAAKRIRSYAENQKMQSWQYTEDDGTVLGQQVVRLTGWPVCARWQGCLPFVCVNECHTGDCCRCR